MKLIYGEYDYFNEIAWAAVQISDGTVYILTDKYKNLYESDKIEAQYAKIAMEHMKSRE